MRTEKRNVGFWGVTGVLLAALAMCVGCGTKLATVEGQVTMDGTPVPQGSIVFEPADGAGPSAGGTIENGKYRLEGAGAVVPGKKKVRITAVKPTGKKIEAGPPNPPGTMVDELKPYIPVAYNEKTTLTVDIPAGKSTHDFKLEAQPK